MMMMSPSVECSGVILLLKTALASGRVVEGSKGFREAELRFVEQPTQTLFKAVVQKAVDDGVDATVAIGNQLKEGYRHAEYISSVGVLVE